MEEKQTDFITTDRLSNLNPESMKFINVVGNKFLSQLIRALLPGADQGHSVRDVGFPEGDSRENVPYLSGYGVHAGDQDRSIPKGHEVPRSADPLPEEERRNKAEALPGRHPEPCPHGKE